MLAKHFPPGVLIYTQHIHINIVNIFWEQIIKMNKKMQIPITPLTETNSLRVCFQKMLKLVSADFSFACIKNSQKCQCMPFAYYNHITS